MSDYDRYRLAAASLAERYPGYGDGDSAKEVRAASKIARSIDGLTYAVLDGGQFGSAFPPSAIHAIVEGGCRSVLRTIAEGDS